MNKLLRSVFLSMFLTGVAAAQFVGVTYDGDIVRIDASTATATLEFSTGIVGLQGMALSPAGRIWCIQRATTTSPKLVEIDTVLGTAASLGFTYLNWTTALARSPSDVLYTIDTPSISKLYVLDMTLVPARPQQLVGDVRIGNLFTQVLGMAFAPNGTLYGWASVYGLITIDPFTGNAAEVDPLTTNTEQIHGLTWAPDGFLYGGYLDLYRIDPATGAVTLLGGPLAFGGIRGLEPFNFTPPISYCKPKRNSAGCLPSIRVQGSSSLSGPDNLQFTASNVLSQKSGLLMWSRTPQQVIFGGGSLCVRSPITRMGAQVSTGAGLCDGTYAVQFSHTYMASKSLQPGDSVFAQWWSRDPGYSAPKNVGLTDGVMIDIRP